MTPLAEIQKFEELAKSDDLALAQSARRVLAKLRPASSFEVLKSATTMRRYAESDDPALRLAAMAWLARRGLSSKAPATGSTQAITERLVKMADRARREGWTKSKRDSEISKVLDTEFPKPRRLRKK